jgi:hypothetical protein
MQRPRGFSAASAESTCFVKDLTQFSSLDVAQTQSESHVESNKAQIQAFLPFFLKQNFSSKSDSTEPGQEARQAGLGSSASGSC